MKKHNKKPRTKRSGTPNNQTNTNLDNASRSRRRFLRLARNGAIASVILGGGGVIGARMVSATMAEHDLSKIGNGTPAVVQIHDPQCAMCRALQKETRQALGDFDEGQMEYLIANIRTPEGSALANRYMVPHVTLLLFDGDGQMIKILNGPKQDDELRREFRAHLIAATAG